MTVRLLIGLLEAIGVAKDRRPKKQQSKYDPRSKDARDRVARNKRQSYLRQRVTDWGGEDVTWVFTPDERTRNVATKMEKNPEIKCEDLPPGQGCGVSGCPICMPADPRGAYGAGGGGGNDRGRGGSGRRSPDELRAAMEQMANRFVYGIDSTVMLDRVAAVMLDPARPSKPVNEEERYRARLMRAEAAAREEVQQFVLDTSQLNVSWEDIAGNEKAHAAMREAIEFPIKHAELYKHYGKKQPKGILLDGPPGCGKTMFGKAAATIVAQLHGKKASMLHIKATELQAPYVGQTEDTIRKVFAYAKAYHALHGHQLVVFIDEADAILPHRNGGPGQRRALPWEESNVATFLTEMDGLEASGALVILATNRPDAIDNAILRDGRIDRKITVQRPDEAAALVIVKKALFNAPMGGMMFESELAQYAIDELFSPYRSLMTLKHEKGRDFFNLSHTVSGAMIVGLVERAKAHAMERDIKAGTITGITEIDIKAAVADIHIEQKERIDYYALREFASSLNVPILELDRVKEPELKFVGTLQ